MVSAESNPDPGPTGDLTLSGDASSDVIGRQSPEK
jgi:hypothetical protein